MKHMRGLVSISQALRQTFLVPQTLPRPQFFRCPPVQPSSQIRLRHWNPRNGPPNQAAKPEELKDEAIRADYIQIVNEDNKLDPPVRLTSVLSSIERPAHFVLQVAPGARDKPPICKIVNRRELRERERALTKAAQASKTSVKQIELNWAIDPHDLSHRLKQMTNFLEKGRQVEIILTRKKHKRTPTPEEVKNVMEKVLQAVKDAGAVQISPMEGEPGKRVMLTVKKKDP
ncbi:translation initiation factor IF-3, C-terminal domain-containing protein [Aspergillus varians]